MSSVGYGDFLAKTVGERQWAIVSIVACDGPQT